MFQKFYKLQSDIRTCFFYSVIQTLYSSKIIILMLNGNFTRMKHADSNISWKQHSTKQKLYSHLLPILQIIQVRWVRPAGHSENKPISDSLLCILTQVYTTVGWLAKTYIHQLYAITGCHPTDLQRAKTNWDRWWERVKGICAFGKPWWW